MTSVAELQISDLFPPARGRKAKDSAVKKLRDLTDADILGLKDAKPISSELTPLKRIRHQHHLLARLLAEGKSVTEASFITGYDIVYISNIKNADPTFKQLVVYYEGQVEEVFLNVHQRLASLGLSTVEELQDRLTDKPESFTHNQLMELAKLSLDRGGYGPSTTINNNSSGLPADLIDQIRKRVAERQTGTIKQIDLQSEERRAELKSLPEGPPERTPSKRLDLSEESWKEIKESI